MKASDLFIRCLEAEGVERIFGVPGEENADFMISLLDSKIDFVLCRHEQAAAFMADVHGRLTGKAGVCLGTLGPGVTNLLTGIADANMDRAPTVAIIGQGSTKRLHKESHQIMDSIRMCEPISKWSQTILAAENITEIVRKAFKIAEAEKPGLTVIELPEDIAKNDVDDQPMSPTTVRRPAADHERIRTDPAQGQGRSALAEAPGRRSGHRRSAGPLGRGTRGLAGPGRRLQRIRCQPGSGDRARDQPRRQGRGVLHQGAFPGASRTRGHRRVRPFRLHVRRHPVSYTHLTLPTILLV